MSLRLGKNNKASCGISAKTFAQMMSKRMTAALVVASPKRAQPRVLRFLELRAFVRYVVDLASVPASLAVTKTLLLCMGLLAASSGLLITFC